AAYAYAVAATWASMAMASRAGRSPSSAIASPCCRSRGTTSVQNVFGANQRMSSIATSVRPDARGPQNDSSAGHGLGLDVAEIAYHPVPVEVGLHRAPAVLSHARGRRRVRQQTADRVGDGRGLLGRNEQARLAVAHGLGHAARVAC